MVNCLSRLTQRWMQLSVPGRSYHLTHLETHSNVLPVRVNPELLAPSAPILLDTDVNKLVSEDDEDAKFVINKLNASKPIRGMYSATEQFTHEKHHGFKAVLETGKLGLTLGDTD